jgi:hypothetical protein
VALKIVNRALDLAAQACFGSYQYYLALCHRCHLLQAAGRQEAALVDLEEASCSELPEVQDAVRVLSAKIGVDFKGQAVSGPKTKTWAERRADLSLRNARLDISALSDLENNLIEQLATKPKSTHELIAALYGPRGSFFDRENRLKQLLHRVRKKRPQLIRYESGCYFLNDPST